MALRFAAAHLGVAALLLAGPALTARAQEPAPLIPDADHRSGLLTRWQPIAPQLPPDPDRDDYYNTRWRPVDCKHRNSPCDGGFYGRRWKNPCVACSSPYFRGAPGPSTLGPDCAPCRGLRAITNLVHPCKPVCTYYAGGCYVPVYDLDPLVPGPGPFPWPIFCRKPNGG